jgi:heme-degrading monooxygenase HmoA
MTRKSGFAYIWEYRVRPGRALDFERAYGPTGPWVSLFKNTAGYLRTELHRDCQTANRYITIDYWDSVEAWQEFRRTMATDFETLDARCEELTVEEREIARLDPIG